MQAEQHEVVTPERQIGEQMLNLNRVSNKPQGHHCGYCESNGSYSWGLTKQMMHPLTYQILAERGWRRCGTYYYKPDIKQSCCKLWTHRLDINKFKIKKDQKKTVRHVVDWLLERIGQQSKKNQLNKTNPKKQTTQKMVQEKSPQQKNKQEKIVIEIPQKWKQLSSITSNLINQIIQKRKEQFFSLFQKNLQTNQSKKQFTSKIDPSKVKCFVSQASADSDFYTNHLMILFGINKKLFNKSYGSVEFIKDIGSFLLTQIKQSFKNDVQVQIQRSGYVLFTQFSSFKLQRKMKKLLISQKEKNMTQKLSKPKNENRMEQQQIKKKHRKQQQNKKKEIDQTRKKTNKLQFSVSSTQICFGPLLIQIVPAEVTTESWRMYQRYCTQIHQKPEKQKSSYSGFLCQKALKYITTFKQNKSGKQYTPSWQQDSEQKQLSQVKGKITKLLGCYHMKYYIQKQLFGVGVVDILPEGLSSVYFFYQPKYKDYRLGVFSSLVQIQYVRWLSLTFPEFKYYYMGFYIQNSQKMNYKGNYQPFDLLCPITYQFVQCNEQLRQLIDKIQKKQIKQVQLSQSNNKINDMNFTMDIGVYINQKVKIKYQGMVLNLKDLNPRILIPVLGMLRDMVQVWGKFIFQTFTFTF